MIIIFKLQVAIHFKSFSYILSGKIPYGVKITAKLILVVEMFWLPFIIPKPGNLLNIVRLLHKSQVVEIEPGR